MTSTERFNDVFDGSNIKEFPVALCYAGLFTRDHIDEISDMPWKSCIDPDINTRYNWHAGVKNRLSHDWVDFPFGYCFEDVSAPISKPVSGGNYYFKKSIEKAIDSIEEIDARLELDGDYDAVEEGPLTKKLRLLYADRPFILGIAAPFWRCCGLWDFDNVMMQAIDNPHLLERAQERFFHNTVKRLEYAKKQGVSLIWIEDCYSDMLSPKLFERLNIVFAKQMVDAIRKLGMKSIYYFTGNPHGKLDLLLSANADAYSFEESKKNFDIDITELAKKINGKHVLLGNIDAIATLQDGSAADIRNEIKRQVAAGRLNDNRFVIGLGSPVTPGTGMDKVMEFLQMAREEAVI